MPATKPSIPTPALVLGVGGLLPFISAALLVWLPQILIQDRNVAQLAVVALGAYGAVILSFLGGVRWGRLLFDDASLERWMPLSISVLPSLIAWPALLLPAPFMLALLSAGFILQYALDIAAVKRGELPPWFGRLRLILTTGAVFSLLIGLLGTVV